MADADAERHVGADRCWPCTISNAAVAAFVGGVPLAAALLWGDDTAVAVTGGWALLVAAYTLYRLGSRGYLPWAKSIARVTGLHDRIGPGEDEKVGRDRE